MVLKTMPAWLVVLTVPAWAPLLMIAGVFVIWFGESKARRMEVKDWVMFLGKF